jgi:CBS domain-containing protein
MRPRQEIVALDIESSISECLDTAEKTRYSRFPLCEGGNLDKTLGVVHIKDLFAMRLKARTGADLLPVIRKLIYVPETSHLERLLRLFLDRKLHFAIVVDEYGGTVGMITLEDILEEIVGEFTPETRTLQRGLRAEADGSYVVAGSTTVRQINRALGWRLPTAVIAPMAGGSLLTKLRKGFGEALSAELVSGAPPRIFGAQAEGRAPIVRHFDRNDDRVIPEVPKTIARSIAIGNPADGAYAAKAIRSAGGGAQAVTDEELVDGIELLAETTGVFTETAGGVTVAAARRLARAGKLSPSDELVLCITGNGLKTVEAVTPALAQTPVIAPRLREVAALVGPA